MTTGEHDAFALLAENLVKQGAKIRRLEKENLVLEHTIRRLRERPRQKHKWCNWSLHGGDDHETCCIYCGVKSNQEMKWYCK